MIRLWALCCLVALCSAAKPTLRFREDNTFHIVQFTDTHFGENPFNDVKTQKVLKNVLEAELPDLIVFTGDVQCSSIIPGITEMAWKMMTKDVLPFNIPWAYVNGNHDTEADKTGPEVIKIDQSYAPSLTQRGPEGLHGSSNYLLHVYPHDNRSTTPAFNLWMLDTGESNCVSVSGGGCIYPDQIEWYRETSRSVNERYAQARRQQLLESSSSSSSSFSSSSSSLSSSSRLPPIPAFAFMHQPTPEYIHMWNYFNVTGLRDEDVCCWAQNTGMVGAFLEMGDTKLMTVGHDHWNDYIGDYHGVALAYGRKTGYGYSGPAKTVQKGSRVFIVTTNPQDPTYFSYTTHIRNEDKTIDTQPEHHPSSKDANPALCVGADGVSKKLY